MEAIRGRIAELDVSCEWLDARTGLQSGYSGKLMGPAGAKNLGPLSFGLMLQALGVSLVMVETIPAAAGVIGSRVYIISATNIGDRIPEHFLRNCIRAFLYVLCLPSHHQKR